MSSPRTCSSSTTLKNSPLPLNSVDAFAGTVINNAIITITNTSYNDVRKIKIISNFSTASLTEHINIYSSYNLDVTLSAKFRKILGE